MSVKTGHKAKTVDGYNAKQHGIPKSLVEIDKHFKLWNASKIKSKINLKSKFIQPITYDGTYGKQAVRKLQEFGKLLHRRVSHR